MPKSLTREIKSDVQDRIEDVANTLLTAADNLSEDAEDAVAKAAKVLRDAAQDLAKRAPAAAKGLRAWVALEPLMTASPGFMRRTWERWRASSPVRAGFSCQTSGDRWKRAMGLIGPMGPIGRFLPSARAA